MILALLNILHHLSSSLNLSETIHSAIETIEADIDLVCNNIRALVTVLPDQCEMVLGDSMLINALHASWGRASVVVIDTVSSVVVGCGTLLASADHAITLSLLEAAISAPTPSPPQSASFFSATGRLLLAILQHAPSPLALPASLNARITHHLNEHKDVREMSDALRFFARGTDPDVLQHRAATILQSAWRGHRTRVHLSKAVDVHRTDIYIYIVGGREGIHQRGARRRGRISLEEEQGKDKRSRRSLMQISLFFFFLILGSLCLSLCLFSFPALIPPRISLLCFFLPHILHCPLVSGSS